MGFLKWDQLSASNSTSFYTLNVIAKKDSEDPEDSRDFVSKAKKFDNIHCCVTSTFECFGFWRPGEYSPNLQLSFRGIDIGLGF